MGRLNAMAKSRLARASLVGLWLCSACGRSVGELALGGSPPPKVARSQVVTVDYSEGTVQLTNVEIRADTLHGVRASDSCANCTFAIPLPDVRRATVERDETITAFIFVPLALGLIILLISPFGGD